MARRFLIVFALTNTFAVGAFSAFAGGRAALGVVLALLALAGFVVTARVVVLARPASHRADEARQLKRQLEESLR
jgi:uncharacterized integral membrane protein